MSNDITGDDRLRFGHWMKDQKLYIGPLTLVGWLMLLGSVVAMMLLLTMGQWQFGIAGVVAAIVVNLLFVVRWGNALASRTVADRVFEAVQGAARVQAGEAQYSTGLFSNLPADKLFALPGVLAHMEELDGTDGRGQPYTLLHHPGAKLLVAVFACYPDGNALQTQGAINREVSWYAFWHSQLSTDTTVAGAAVVVDSALRPSAPLVQRVDMSVDPDAPEIAQQATREAARRLPGRYSESTAWAVVAFKIDSLATSTEEAEAEVASKIPYHIDLLRDAGAGAVIPATSQMLAQMARVSYDPERSAEYGLDELQGFFNPMRVSEAGPEYFDDAHRRVVLHDGVASMSALMLVPPRMEITESTMNMLFAPANDMLRKRTTVLYRPVPPDQTMNVVERATKNTRRSASASGGEDSAQTQVDKATNRRMEDQVAHGAMMTRFGILVSVTFNADQRSYRAALTKLKSLLEGTGLTYRFCEWDAGPALHVSMPLGILPWLYETLPQQVARAAS